MCWEWAGVVGVNPLPLTMRELAAMVTGQRRDTWDQWAFIASWISRISTGEDINPETLNPIRRADLEKLQTPELKRQDAREMMCLIGVALGDKKAVERWLSVERVRAEEAAARTASALAKPSSS